MEGGNVSNVARSVGHRMAHRFVTGAAREHPGTVAQSHRGGVGSRDGGRCFVDLDVVVEHAARQTGYRDVIGNCVGHLEGKKFTSVSVDRKEYVQLELEEQMGL